MNGFDQILTTQAAITKAAPQLAQLKQSCQGMEAAFMKTLVTQMRKGTNEVHFGQQLGGDMYRDMFDDTLSNMLAANQGSGLAQAMEAPMDKQVVNHAMAEIRTAVQKQTSEAAK